MPLVTVDSGAAYRKHAPESVAKLTQLNLHATLQRHPTSCNPTGATVTEAWASLQRPGRIREWGNIRRESAGSHAASVKSRGQPTYNCLGNAARGLRVATVIARALLPAQVERLSPVNQAACKQAIAMECDGKKPAIIISSGPDGHCSRVDDRCKYL